MASALSRGTGSSKPAASGYSWSRGFARNGPLFSSEEPGRRVSSSESRSASRSIAGIDWCRHGPRRERCYVPRSRGAKPQRLHRGCKIRASDLLSQVGGLKPTNVTYSHSFTPVCCGVIPVNSSWAVGLDCLAAKSRRVTSRRRLGQTLGQIRKLFRNRKPTVSFLSRGQKRVGFEALKRPI